MATNNPQQNVSTEPIPERQSNRPVARPAVQIVDSTDYVRLFVDMPGVDESSADISLDRNVLTIRGMGRDAGPAGFELVHSEYSIGDYERAFTVSDEIDRDAIDAVFTNGVLQLTLPKAKETGARQIQIRSTN